MNLLNPIDVQDPGTGNIHEARITLNYAGSYLDGSRLNSKDDFHSLGCLIANVLKSQNAEAWNPQTKARMSEIAAEHNIPIEKLQRPRKYWDHEPAIIKHNGVYRVLVLCNIPQQSWRYSYQAEAFAQRCRDDLEFAQVQGINIPLWLSDVELLDKENSPLHTEEPLYNGYGDCALLEDIRDHALALLERSLALEAVYAITVAARAAYQNGAGEAADTIEELLELGAVLADARATYFEKHNRLAALEVSQAAAHHLQYQIMANAMNNADA